MKDAPSRIGTLVDDLLDAAASLFPDKIALIHDPTEITYRQFQEEADRWANYLVETGVQRGDRVGIYLDAGIDQSISIFAVSKANALFVILHVSLKEEQVRYIVTDCGIRVLISSRSKVPFLQDLNVRILSAEEMKRSKNAVSQKVLDDQESASIIYTSGSTGSPKGVLLTHRNIVLGARAVSEYLSITERDRILSVLPFSFDYGLNQLMTSVLKGSTLIIKKVIFGRDIVNALEDSRATGLAGIPTVWIMLLEALGGMPGPKTLRYLTNSGGKLPVQRVQELRRAFPSASLYLMYGLTEAFRSTYLEPSQVDRRPDSIGKPIPYADIYVINEQGRECGPDEVGELIHGGPLVSKGYWGKPEETAQKIRQNPLTTEPDPVCYSGDFVKKDEEAYLYFIGRKDEMIKSSGFRISPTEIEEVLARHPKIAQAVAVGVPDERLGQRIRVVLTLKAGETLDARNVSEYCRSRLPSYMTPDEIEFRSQMPLTAHGKVDRLSLIRN